MKLPHNLPVLFFSMLIVDSSIFKVAKSFFFPKLIVSFSYFWNLLLFNGLRFISVVISLSLKFKVYALRLDQLQSTVWLWLLWKCQKTFDSSQSSLSATLLKNQ
jgi:hypothetical protein